LENRGSRTVFPRCLRVHLLWLARAAMPHFSQRALCSVRLNVSRAANHVAAPAEASFVAHARLAMRSVDGDQKGMRIIFHLRQENGGG